MQRTVRLALRRFCPVYVALLGVDFAILVRYDPQDMLEVVGTWTRTGAPAPTPVSGRLPLGGRNVTTVVYQTGRPARIDYSDVSGVIGRVALGALSLAPG